jgi:hypothetical protein
MENPYAAPEVTPELATEERRRPKFWRGLLIAYAVHHLASVVGMVIGVLVKPSEFSKVFPLDKPLDAIRTVVFIPIIDLFILLEPVFLTFAIPELATVWHWLRIPVALIIPVAAFRYAASRRRDWLWVVAVVSMGVYVTFVLWHTRPPSA